MDAINDTTEDSTPINAETEETAYEEGIADTNNSKFAEDIKHSTDTRPDPAEEANGSDDAGDSE